MLPNEEEPQVIPSGAARRWEKTCYPSDKQRHQLSIIQWIPASAPKNWTERVKKRKEGTRGGERDKI